MSNLLDFIQVSAHLPQKKNQEWQILTLFTQSCSLEAGLVASVSEDRGCCAPSSFHPSDSSTVEMIPHSSLLPHSVPSQWVQAAVREKSWEIAERGVCNCADDLQGVLGASDTPAVSFPGMKV